MALNKQQINNAQDLPLTEVEVKEWGGSVLLRTMTGKERDDFENHIMANTNKDEKLDTRGLRVLLLGLTLVDEDGNRLFQDDELEELQSKSSKVINDLFEKAQELNGLSDNEVEDLVKN